MKEMKICPTCEGFAIRLCPWCKIDIRDDTGKVIGSKPGTGCRMCEGKSKFTCTTCNGEGRIDPEEIVISSQE